MVEILKLKVSSWRGTFSWREKLMAFLVKTSTAFYFTKRLCTLVYTAHITNTL